MSIFHIKGTDLNVKLTKESKYTIKNFIGLELRPQIMSI